MWNSFWTTLKRLLYEMFYEDEYLSLTRVIAFMGYLLFSIGSIYLLVFNIDWSGYSVFSSYTGGGGAALQFANKFINSKYNSIPGGYDEAKIGDKFEEHK